MSLSKGCNGKQYPPPHLPREIFIGFVRESLGSVPTVLVVGTAITSSIRSFAVSCPPSPVPVISTHCPSNIFSQQKKPNKLYFLSCWLDFSSLKRPCAVPDVVVAQSEVRRVTRQMKLSFTRLGLLSQSAEQPVTAFSTKTTADGPNLSGTGRISIKFHRLL